MTKKIQTIDYQNFTQVTTAGHVIEQIRADILWNRGEQAKRLMSKEVRYAKIQALHGLLNTLILQEMKMDAWQEMKGSEKITGDLYKQMANQELYEHDKAVSEQELGAVDLDKELCNWNLDDDEGTQHETAYQKEDRLAMEKAEASENVNLDEEF